MSGDRKLQVQCILFFKDKAGVIKYLILKRSPSKGAFWRPVTGGVHHHESPNEAALREVEEETGLKKIRTLIDSKYTFSFTLQSGRVLEERVFLVEVEEMVNIVLSDEHTEYQWLAIEDAVFLLEWDSNKEALWHCDRLLRS